MTSHQSDGSPGQASDRKQTRLTRRELLFLLSIGAGLGFPGTDTQAVAALADALPDGAGSVPFYGPHQAGIATRPQQRLVMAAFDLTTRRQSPVSDLLRGWSDLAAQLCRASSSRLTITVGLGPSLFERDGVDRFGLASVRPPALVSIPAMRHDQLVPARSDGDLCLQICADVAQDAATAFHRLRSLAGGSARLRWLQHGFGPTGDGNPAHRTPRNLLGFKDGTDNITGSDASLMAEEVWVGPEDEPSWMRGGTYLVARRILLHLDLWNRLPIGQQQHIIGRNKTSGAPLGEEHEFDPVNLDATGANGDPLIPLHAHVRLARETGRRILRRGYGFNGGRNPETGELDAGLFFIAFQRDPRRQFIPVQQKLAAHDALNRFITHTGSAVFACPPGAQPGGYVGQELFTQSRPDSLTPRGNPGSPDID